MMTYTRRRNVNRGYMQLDVWHLGMDLCRFVRRTLESAKIDLRLRSQLADAALSVPANIAEGYSRRSVREYMYHVNVSLGSLSEVMTRTVALLEQGDLSEEEFEEFDALHYELENKLLSLLRSLQKKARDGSWEMELRTSSAKDVTH